MSSVSRGITAMGLVCALVWTAAADDPPGRAVDGGHGRRSNGVNRNVNVTVIVGHNNQITADFAPALPGATDSPGEAPYHDGFKRNVNVTVIVGNNNRITSNITLSRPNTSDAPKAHHDGMQQVEQVPTSSENEFLGIPAVGNPSAAPVNGAGDAELRRQVFALLAAPDAAQADAAAKSIETYVSGNAELRRQLHDVARLLLPSTSKYQRVLVSPHAAGYVRKWLIHDRHGTLKPRER